MAEIASGSMRINVMPCQALPLYVTSMLVPFLVVVLRVLHDESGARLDPPAAAPRIFHAMMSQVQL